MGMGNAEYAVKFMGFVIDGFIIVPILLYIYICSMVGCMMCLCVIRMSALAYHTRALCTVFCLC